MEDLAEDLAHHRLGAGDELRLARVLAESMRRRDLIEERSVGAALGGGGPSGLCRGGDCWTIRSSSASGARSAPGGGGTGGEGSAGRAIRAASSAKVAGSWSRSRVARRRGKDLGPGQDPVGVEVIELAERQGDRRVSAGGQGQRQLDAQPGHDRVEVVAVDREAPTACQRPARFDRAASAPAAEVADHANGAPIPTGGGGLRRGRAGCRRSGRFRRIPP